MLQAVNHPGDLQASVDEKQTVLIYSGLSCLGLPQSCGFSLVILKWRPLGTAHRRAGLMSCLYCNLPPTPLQPGTANWKMNS